MAKKNNNVGWADQSAGIFAKIALRTMALLAVVFTASGQDRFSHFIGLDIAGWGAGERIGKMPLVFWR